MKSIMHTNIYEEPTVELIYVEVEEGFEGSTGNWGEPGEDPNFNDFGEF